MNDQNQPLERLVSNLELRATLLPDDRAALLALPCTRRHYEASSYLVRDGQPPDTCAVLLSGFAYRQKLTRAGARQIVSLHIPGEALDLQNVFLDVADHDVLTLTRAEAAIIPRSAIREVSRRYPSIAHAMLVYTLVEASILREWVLNVGRRDARTRLAHLLCEFAMRMDANGHDPERPYELPMSQEQLGDALGLTSVHINRTLKALEADGLLTREKRHVRFPNWDQLRQTADFNARYLHLGQPAC